MNRRGFLGRTCAALGAAILAPFVLKKSIAEAIDEKAFNDFNVALNKFLCGDGIRRDVPDVKSTPDIECEVPRFLQLPDGFVRVSEYENLRNCSLGKFHEGPVRFIEN